MRSKSIAQEPERFEKILQRLKAGEMPPKTMPRPDAEAQNSGLTTQGSKSR